MASNLPSGLSTSDLIHIGEIDDPYEIDQDAYEEWAEDKSYGIIVENLQDYLIVYADKIAEKILEPWDYTTPDTYGDIARSNWQSLSDHSRSITSFDLLMFMAEMFIKKNEEDLLEEYTKEQEGNRKESV